MKMGKWSKWVALCFLCFSLSLQTIQGYKESETARTLKLEQGDAHEVHCSRERSRAAWKIIEEYLMPFVEKERYQISRRCRLHPDNDLYRDQEQHKIHVDVNEWQCGYCRKRFYEEKHLDQHFDNRHYDLLECGSNAPFSYFVSLTYACNGKYRLKGSGFLILTSMVVRIYSEPDDSNLDSCLSHSRCFADICGALHCDLVMDSAPRKTKCNPAAAAKNQHLCESLADTCFRLMRVLQQAVFMNSSCANSVMPTLALEVRNPSLEGTRRLGVYSTFLLPF
ncbi:hypothetical protein SLA2020_339970 [Shorea laevis]